MKASSPRHAAMDLRRERLHALGQFLRKRGQLRVEAHQLHQLIDLVLGGGLSLQAGDGQRLAMLRIGVRMSLVASA